ncbi:MAG TPA: LssY C-terminal domain-containing protein [Steroidobacteraceae bacterium]|nr:LssY C-terminal domain-containing protein [Steroidobacteraceae bacterium]
MSGLLQRAGSAIRLAYVAGAMLLLGACATWQAPTDTSDAPLRARAITQQKGSVQVSAAVLGAQDSLRLFGTDVTAAGVQPVWIEVDNRSDHILWLLRTGTDPDYFSPLEVAWSAHVTFGGNTNERIDEQFSALAFPNPIPASGTASGIVFTNPQPVTKLVNVDLLGNRAMVPFTLLLPVPGDIAAGTAVIHRYSDAEIASYDDPDALRKAIEALPCCAASDEGAGGGGPINVVLIGALDDVAAAANRRGYRRAVEPPGTPQQLFGRPADFFVRKTAQAGAPAVWLRIWRAPINYLGEPVLVAQAGRPVGGRFSAGSADESRLNPDVDEVRNLVIQDFMYSGGLEQLAFASGVGAVPADQPRVMADGGGYYTDGRRAALFLVTRPLAFSDVELLDWEPVLPEKQADAGKE